MCLFGVVVGITDLLRPGVNLVEFCLSRIVCRDDLADFGFKRVAAVDEVLKVIVPLLADALPVVVHRLILRVSGFAVKELQTGFEDLPWKHVLFFINSG